MVCALLQGWAGRSDVGIRAVLQPGGAEAAQEAGAAAASWRS
jgi:hypothetical protein